MKIINIEINDIINIKNIEDIDTGYVRNINSVLRIPTGNYKNVLLNFSFISPKIEDDMKIVASFGIDNKENIDVEITKVSINDKDYLTACYIPPEVFLNPCKVCFGVYGFSLNNDELLKQRFSLIPVAEIVVKGSYNPDSKESIVPSPTVFEVYFNKIDKLKNDFEIWKTEKEKEIDKAIASKFSYLHKYDNYLITTENVTSIPIDLDVEYREADIFQVKINGLDFIMGKDFTISDNNINFISTVESKNIIYYSIERYITTDINDYSILIGAPGKDGLGVPAGGSKGQVLAKKSNSDNDTEWIEQITDNESLKGFTLWENPNSTENFNKQNIKLSTDDYSYFDVLYYSSLDTLRVETARIYKDCNSLLNTIFEYNMKVYYGTRKVNRISDIEYEITAAATSSSSNETTMNVTNCIVPIKVIGYRR